MASEWLADSSQLGRGEACLCGGEGRGDESKGDEAWLVDFGWQWQLLELGCSGAR